MLIIFLQDIFQLQHYSYDTKTYNFRKVQSKQLLKILTFERKCIVVYLRKFVVCINLEASLIYSHLFLLPFVN